MNVLKITATTLLAAIAVFALAACSSNSNAQSGSAPAADQKAPQEQPAQAPAQTPNK